MKYPECGELEMEFDLYPHRRGWVIVVIMAYVRLFEEH